MVYIYRPINSWSVFEQNKIHPIYKPQCDNTGLQTSTTKKLPGMNVRVTPSKIVFFDIAIIH